MTIIQAHEIPLAEQASIFNRAFAGYLAGWTDLDAAGLARFIYAQGADLFYSRFVRVNGTPAGFGYINRTGNIPRLAGMGTVPEAQRHGAATYLLSQLLDEAKQRGDEAMVLEVFEQNEPALKLYQRHGFRVLARLFGWRREAAQPTADANASIEAISIIAASECSGDSDYPFLPWQISRHAMTKLPRAHAFRVNDVTVVVGDPAIRIHGLFYKGSRTDAARSALARVLREFPDREFFAPQIFPELFGEVFEPLGFIREPLNQLLMRRDL